MFKIKVSFKENGKTKTAWWVGISNENAVLIETDRNMSEKKFNKPMLHKIDELTVIDTETICCCKCKC